jgi:hypothetical protein
LFSHGRIKVNYRQITTDPLVAFHCSKSSKWEKSKLPEDALELILEFEEETENNGEEVEQLGDEQNEEEEKNDEEKEKTDNESLNELSLNYVFDSEQNLNTDLPDFYLTEEYKINL